MLSLLDEEKVDDALLHAFLKAPCFVDRYGRLYSLDKSGGILCVNFNNRGGRTTGFQSYGRNEYGLSWLVIENNLYINRGEKLEILKLPDEAVSDYHVLPTPNSVAKIISNNIFDCIVINSRSSKAYFYIRENDNLYSLDLNNISVSDLWIDDDKLYFIGMRSRVIMELARDAESSLGSPLLGCYNLITHEVDTEIFDSRNFETLDVGFFKQTGRKIPAGCLVENFLSRFGGREEHVSSFVGGVVQINPFMYTGDEISSYVDFKDYVLVAVFQKVLTGSFKLVKLFYPYAFIGIIEAKGECYKYFVEYEESKEFSSVNSIKCSNPKSGMDLLDVKINGLDKSGKFESFYGYYDNDINFYGSLSIRDSSRSRSYLIRSENGIQWYVASDLIEPPLGY